MGMTEYRDTRLVPKADEQAVVHPPARVHSLASRRVNILFTLLAIVAAAAAGAWFAGSRIESPAEVAARTAAPKPSPILVPVERRVLSADIVTRGTARYGLPQPVSLAPSPLKPSPGLITHLPLRNTQIHEGDVVLTASGRPVFVLLGDVPAYRDLVPGLVGEDVRQLKDALRRLGFDPGPDADTYDARTSAAVEAWYRSKGWEPFGATRDQLAAVRALEREWGEALKAKMAAAAAVESAGLAVQAARATAAYNARAVTMDRGGRSPSDLASSPLLASERARVAHANTAAEADVAQQIAEHSLITLDPRQTATARAAADAKLQVAQANRDRIRLEGEMALRNAEREGRMAAERAGVVRAGQRSAYLEGEKAVRAALDAENLATLDLKLATQRVDQAAAELDQARRRLGIQMPIDEVVFIRSLPVRVEDITATIGSPASGTVLTVTDNQLSVDAALTLEAAPMVKPGMRVAIDEQALGVSASGVIETVANTPGTRGADGFHYYVGIRVDPTPIRLAGMSVRLTIPIETTDGAVLAVPVSALSMSTDGTTRVQVHKDGALRYVPVRAGLSTGGYVEVAAGKEGLSPGQMVVVGYDMPSAGQDGR
ncbi:MAG: peptidoglycan-binding protein [Acetobacteraceae bacterium]